jgi:hypothetical protein
MRCGREASRYELVAWQPALHENTGAHIVYDHEYVELRDRDAKQDRHDHSVSTALWYLAVFLGFLPSRVKDHIGRRYGIDPVTATRRSIVLELFLAIDAIGLSVFCAATHAMSPVIPWISSGILFIDCIIRWDRVLAEEPSPPGLLEWVISRR